MNKPSLILFLALGATGLLPAQTPPATHTEPLCDIQIRDPFVVPDREQGAYYLFGTSNPDKMYRSEGFDGYRSTDLENWEGPYPLFRPSPGFWGAGNFWAAECHPYRGKYYLFATIRGKADSLLGTTVLVADAPMGPYREHSKGRVTPEGWNSLDGTLYVDGKGDPWMVFCHEWTQVGDGTIEAVRLSRNLKKAVGKPRTLFAASSAPWVRSHMPGGGKFVTDGPFLYRNRKGELLMLWSSFSDRGYAIGIARSATGEVPGPWEQIPLPLFRQDGGHGMLFRTLDGQLMLSIHQPNRTPDERAHFFEIHETDEGLPEFNSVIVEPGRQKKLPLTN